MRSLGVFEFPNPLDPRDLPALWTRCAVVRATSLEIRAQARLIRADAERVRAEVRPSESVQSVESRERVEGVEGAD